MIPDPVRFSQLYDSIELGGRRSPGLFTFSSPPMRDQGWDVQKGKGQTGATTVHNETPPIEFEGQILLWNEDDRDDFAEWDSFKEVLTRPVDPNSPKALDIYHPQLADLNPPVASVVITSMTDPAPNTGKLTGSSTVKIRFLEFRPPKPKKSAAPNGSTSGGAGGAGGAGSAGGKKAVNDPNADLKREIEGLRQEYKKG